MGIEEEKKDGWANALSGLEDSKVDKTLHTSWGFRTVLDDSQLSSMYNSEGLAARIVDMMADDMTREGWALENDTEGLILDEFKRLDVQEKVNYALKQARLFRGSLIVIVTENERLEEPLRENKKIKMLRVYSAARVFDDHNFIVSNPSNPYYDDFEYYTIRLKNGELQRIHASRCLVFKGEPSAGYDSNTDLTHEYWGYSILQKCYDRLKNYGAVEQGLANLMLEANIGKFKFSNLKDILANNEDGQRQLLTRLNAINRAKSLINAVVFDEDEDYIRDTVNLSGIPEMLDRMQMNLSAVTGYPVTKLFGRSPSGMNATGESDMRNYYDVVSAKQESILRPALMKLIRYIEINAYGEPTEDRPSVFVKFNSLWNLDEKKKAEITKIEAEVYEKYINLGVLSPEEVREMKFPEVEQ